jgi:hypothetical protein
MRQHQTEDFKLNTGSWRKQEFLFREKCSYTQVLNATNIGFALILKYRRVHNFGKTLNA